MKLKQRGRVLISVLLAITLMFSNLSPISWGNRQAGEVKAAPTEKESVDLTKLREITWSDFYNATLDSTINTDDTQLHWNVNTLVQDGSAASINNTIFNGDVALGYGRRADDTTVGGELRYGASFFGLAIKLTDAGLLNIGAAYYDFSNTDIAKDYSPAQFGINSETFEGQRFNLKIAVVDLADDLTSARMAVWINNVMVGGDFFTLTLQSAHYNEAEFNHILVRNDEGIVDPEPSTMELPQMFPIELNEISWSDYGIPAYTDDAKVRFEIMATPNSEGMDNLQVRFFQAHATGNVNNMEQVPYTFSAQNTWETVEIDLAWLLNDSGKFQGIGFGVFGGAGNWDGTTKYTLSFRNMQIVDGDATEIIRLDSSNVSWATASSAGLEGLNDIGTSAFTGEGCEVSGLVMYCGHEMTFTNPVSVGEVVSGWPNNTYEAGINGTIFNADIAFATNGTDYGDFRYGGEWGGIVFQLTTEGKLFIKSDQFDWTGAMGTYTTCAPETFGLVTFKGTRFNLKIAVKDMNADKTSATVGIWINNIMVGGGYSTLTINDSGTAAGATFNNVMLRNYVSAYVPTLGMPTGASEEEPEAVNITWKDFGVKYGTVYTAEDGWTSAEYAATDTLNNTVFEDKIIFTKNSGIRYGGSDSSFGLHIGVNGEGQLCLSSDTFTLEDLTSATYNAVDFGLDTLTDTELTLKIAMSNVTSTTATVGVWINGQVADESFTMTENGQWSASLGNRVCLYDGTYTDGVVAIPEPELTKITWTDFTGAQYGKTYNDQSSDYNVTYKGTDLNNTLFEDEIIFAANTELRYATATGWTGLNLKVDENGDLNIYSDAFAFTNLTSGTYKASEFGLDTLANEEITLSIKMLNVTTTSADVAVSVNGIQAGNKFTMTSKGEGNELGNVVNIGYYGPITIPVRVPIPTDLTEITWEDFGVTCGVNYTGIEGNYPPVRTAYHLTNLNDTLFNGDVQMSADSQFRYGGKDSIWYGIHINVNADGTLSITSDTFDIVRDSVPLGSITANPYVYGLTSFVDTRFNLKIAMTDVTETSATVGVWVNNKIVDDMFMITSKSPSGYLLGSSMGIGAPAGGTVAPYSLKTTAPTGLKAVKLSDWTPTVYDNGKWDHYETNGESHPDVDTLVGTTFKETFNFVGPTDSSTDMYMICYGGRQGTGQTWTGLRIAFSDDKMILYGAGDGVTDVSFTDSWTLDAETAGVESFVDTEYQLKIDMVALGEHVLMYLSFDGRLYNHAPIVLYNFKGQISDTIVFRAEPNSTPTYAILGSSERTLADLYHNVKEGAYKIPAGIITMQKKSIVDGVENWIDMEVGGGDTLSVTGDYKITYNDGISGYNQEVILYRPGDAKLDDQDTINAVDLVRELKYLKGLTSVSYKSEEKAYDVDGNSNVDADDVKVLRQMLLGVYEEDETAVMPIVGHFGPIGRSVNDEMYKKIQEAGINRITQYENLFTDNAGDRYSVYQQLTMAQKYGMDITVQDDRLISGEQENVQEAIAPYKDYQSFGGLYIVDEPYSSFYPTETSDCTVDAYAAVGTAASAENVFGYGNLLGFWWKAGKNQGAAYDYVRYARDYVDKLNAPYLSFTYYPFWTAVIEQGNIGNGVEEASQFFENLAMIRSVANEKNIPFWSFVQTGDGFEYAPTANNPSEGEFKWQANVSLAFGAKGIQYFPVVQPDYFNDVDEDTVSSGLIDQDGKKSEWYDYAVDVNTQISAIDHVLMNATSEGLMATGGYAKSQATDYVKRIELKEPKLGGLYYSTVETLTTTVYSEYANAIVSVADEDSTYGALTGCFSYEDKHALYIVNYDVTDSSKITVTFTSEVESTIILNGNTEKQTGNSITKELGAGEAMLVVY